MEEIAQLKSKHVKNNQSMLKHLLLSQIETIDEIKRNQDQLFNENESKIKELMSKLAVIKETLYTEIQTVEYKNNELLEHNSYLKKLEAEKQKLLQEIKQLEAKRNNIKSAKPNLQDQQVLEQGKKKIKLYKELTKIHWDYEATQHSIKGYVSNKCDYIHHFCYKDQKINEKLIDSLWREIYLSTSMAKIRDESFSSN